MNTNMIVAFGFTGVSTALTVMADIEVLDIITWSWTSVYTPNATGPGGKPNRIGGQGDNAPSSPSISIVAGAVTGGLVVFILILVAFYFLSSHHQKRRNNKSGNSSLSNLSTPVTESHRANRINSVISHHVRHEMMEITFKDRPSSTEPFEYQARRPSAPTPHPLQITGGPTRSDTITTSTTVVTNASSVVLLPSPWSKVRKSGQDKGVETSDWMIRRAASTPTHHPMQSIASVSKPDDKYYPVNQLRRAATVSESNNSLTHTLTNNSSTDTITNKNVKRDNTTNKEPITTNNKEEEEDDTFDRQEFVLRSDEVAKIDDS